MAKTPSIHLQIQQQQQKIKSFVKRNKNQFSSDLLFNQHYDSIQDSINNSINLREFNSGRTSPHAKKSHSYMSHYKR